MDTHWTPSLIKGKILHKLTRMGKFHHSHTSIENLPKGFPKDLAGKVKESVAELIKERILFTKPTAYGLEVSINTEKKERIMQYIDEFLKIG